MIDLSLETTGETVRLTLTEYVGSTRFAQFRSICAQAGATYSSAIRGNRAPLSAVPVLLKLFADAEFPVKVDAAVRDRLKEGATEAQELLAAGRARLAVAEAALAPRGLKLFPYQRTGVEWLAPRDRALLADEMGLGKTMQVLLALPEKAAALVVVPAAAKYTWEGEVKKWRPDLTPVLLGSKQVRWPSAGEVCIVTYGLLPDPKAPKESRAPLFSGARVIGAEDGSDLAALGVPAEIVYVVADEAHAVKNPGAQRTQRFRALCEVVRANQGKVWLVTGTPLLNRPPELWAILETADLATEAFGSWSTFVRLFQGVKGTYGYDWGKPQADVPLALRRVALRRNRVEVLPDLPRKIRQDVPVNGLDPALVAKCDQVIELLESHGIFLEDGGDPDDLLKRIGGVAFHEISAARAALATAKIPAMLESAESYEEEETPVVFFSCHKEPVLELGRRPDWVAVTGETPQVERGQIERDFQAGKYLGVAATIESFGVAVTLTRAAHVVLVDLPWTPAKVNQAEDRCARIGQTAGSVLVRRLIAKHRLEERVVELLTKKQEMIEKSVEASAVPADYMGASPAAELAEAASMAATQVDETSSRETEIRQKYEAEKAETREREVREAQQRLGADWDGRALDVSGKFRSPANAVEEWAAKGLVTLAGLDPDRARDQNGVGFSATDGDFGHSLAQTFQRSGRLSDKQWTFALRIAAKYTRQIGPAPSLKRKEGVR